MESPIIICGVARSGTTFVRDLVNSHPEIAMSDELFLYRVPTVQKLFHELEHFIPNRISKDDWLDRRAQLMRDIWFSVCQAEKTEKSYLARRFGNKTPGAEHYIEFYDWVFASALPKYVYVLREGRKVFISRRNVNWGGKVPSIRSRVKNYLDSIEKMETFRKKAPDRISVIQLDRIKNNQRARLNLAESLFSFFGERIVPEVIEFVEKWAPVQTSRQVSTKVEIFSQLRPEEQEFIDHHKAYQRICERYGYAE